jgi:hypothetical protein
VVLLIVGFLIETTSNQIVLFVGTRNAFVQINWFSLFIYYIAAVLKCQEVKNVAPQAKYGSNKHNCWINIHLIQVLNTMDSLNAQPNN